jgi:hypothetical protein
MSLEAIAALLGHKSMRMTMVYAKIANRTVAEEYFAVSEKVEALYDQPKQLPATAEGAEMRKLRAEMHWRMLGNATPRARLLLWFREAGVRATGIGDGPLPLTRSWPNH